MKIEVGFGTSVQQAEIPEKNILAVLNQNQVEHEFSGEGSVKNGLEHPIGSPRLRELAAGKEKIVIITSDITRPVPTYQIMPSVLDELYAGGAKPENITLVFALGSHRRHTEEEKKRLAGERAYTEIRCIDGDNTDFVHMGDTKAGTPIDIVRVVAEADMRICLGNIEYHYFAGYSGGAKAIMPGVSTFAAIQANHRMMVDERSHAGNIRDNPVRKDIEEAAAVVGVDFIVNVVLDEEHKIIYTAAGDVTKAHRAGCAFLDKLYQIRLKERADIVIVSQGGAPKDLNLYQTQKALDNAKHAVKDGGIIILVGSCKEGLGQKTFEQWLLEADKPQDIIDRLKADFRLGGHKAAAVAMVLQHAEVYLVSEMDPELVKSIFLTPAASLQEAYDRAAEKLGKDATVIIMPFGGSTLPIVEGD